MALLVNQTTNLAGTEPTYAAADVAGDEALFHEDLVLHVKNGGVADITLSVASPVPCNQGFNHATPIVVTAGEARFIGPFERRNIDTDNNVSWTYSAVTSVTIAALVV